MGDSTLFHPPSQHRIAQTSKYLIISIPSFPSWHVKAFPFLPFLSSPNHHLSKSDDIGFISHLRVPPSSRVVSRQPMTAHRSPRPCVPRIRAGASVPTLKVLRSGRTWRLARAFHGPSRDEHVSLDRCDQVKRRKTTLLADIRHFARETLDEHGPSFALFHSARSTTLLIRQILRGSLL